MTESGSAQDQWVDGDLESGADGAGGTDPASDIPDEGDDGVSVGAGEPSTFEPEEDTESLPEEAVTETPMQNRQQA